MATKTIPERKIVTCDVCGVETYGGSFQGGPGLRLRKGVLIVKSDALDYQNHAVADATVTRDLCDACLQRISFAINAETTAIRQEVKANDESK